MSGTHRGLNRLLLILLGLILFTAGALTAAAGINPDIARTWTRTGAEGLAWALQQIRSAPIADTGISWWTVAILAALILAIVLLICWIASQGGGQTGQLGAHPSRRGDGITTVDTTLAARAIRDAMAEDQRILSTDVSSWNVRDTDGLTIAIQVRRGASPGQIAAKAEEIMTGLDTLLGEQIPVLIHIRAGTRTRFARPERVR